MKVSYFIAIIEYDGIFRRRVNWRCPSSKYVTESHWICYLHYYVDRILSKFQNFGRWLINLFKRKTRVNAGNENYFIPIMYKINERFWKMMLYTTSCRNTMTFFISTHEILAWPHPYPITCHRNMLHSSTIQQNRRV